MSRVSQLWSSVRRTLAGAGCDVGNRDLNDRPVDFVIGGTQKGGTTALDAYLREHPQLCMAANKELHFFDDESQFASRTPDYRRYHAAFRLGEQHRMVGESTPIYMYWQAAPGRIHAYNPGMRWILVLRNPIERAYSHWNMERQRGAESLPFAQAIEQEEARCAAAMPQQHRVYSYVDRGFYLPQLQRIWQLFDRSQVLVLKHEQLRAAPNEALAQVCDFLEVDRLAVEAREVHARSYDAPIEPHEWDDLRQRFEPSVRGLERTLGWDCSDWLTRESA